jgi:hypothetical protein
MLKLINFPCFHSHALDFGHMFKLMFYSFRFWPHVLMSWTYFERFFFGCKNNQKTQRCQGKNHFPRTACEMKHSHVGL